MKKLLFLSFALLVEGLMLTACSSSEDDLPKTPEQQDKQEQRGNENQGQNANSNPDSGIESYAISLTNTQKNAVANNT